jgi:hypothetical protein
VAQPRDIATSVLDIPILGAKRIVTVKVLADLEIRPSRRIVSLTVRIGASAALTLTLVIALVVALTWVLAVLTVQEGQPVPLR